MYFQTYTDKRGRFRWRLRGGNGEILASGQGYKDERDRANVIELLKTCAAAPVRETNG